MSGTQPDPSSVQTPAVGGPSRWIERFFPGVAAGGQVLDVACGSGRNLRAAHRKGLAVTGIDRTLQGVSDLGGQPGITLIEADLEDGRTFPLAGRRYDAVVVSNYLWRPLLPDLIAATAEDGLFLYETFAIGQERFGRPSNPDFLLRPNELLDIARPRLSVIAYEHGLIDAGIRPRIVQRIAACGPRHAWARMGAETGIFP